MAADTNFGLPEPIVVEKIPSSRRVPHDGGAGRTLLTVAQVCRHLNIAPSTWAKWRQRQVGPPVIRLPNGSLRVNADELTAWIESCRESA